MRLVTFPKLILERRGRVAPQLNLQLAHELHPYMMSKTALHAETLARLGLMKSKSDYLEGNH